MINFPSSPTMGQLHPPTTTGKQWKWNGAAWDIQSMSDTVVSKVEALVATAESAAENSGESAAASEAALDDFKKHYQGAHASDPTTRYDGSPLEVGDLYFNSTINKVLVWASAGYWSEATPTVQVLMSGTFNAPIVAMPGQTVVPVAGGYDSPFILVWVNGVQVEKPDIDVSSGTNIVFAAPLSASDEVTYRAFGAFKVVGEASIKVGTFQAPAAAGQFAVTGLGFRPRTLEFTVTLPSATSSQQSTGTTDGATQVCHATAVFSTGARSDAVSGAVLQILDAAGAVQCSATLTSLDADGFTLNFTNTAVRPQCLYKAWA